MGECFTLRRDADSLGEPLVKFRLFYEGPLYASKGDAWDGQSDRRAPHKHDIRRAFHRQLKHFWSVHPWLSKTSAGWDVLGLRNDPAYDEELSRMPRAGSYGEPYMWQHLAYVHRISDRSFVPLVCEQFKLLCELDILLLRRDRPGGIIQARDIDNRLKTLFDALRMPRNGTEILSAEFGEADDDPCFVLLQNDDLITHVHVETDELLDPPPESGRDDSWVRLLVHVKLHPFDVNNFNISFA